MPHRPLYVFIWELVVSVILYATVYGAIEDKKFLELVNCVDE